LSIVRRVGFDPAKAFQSSSSSTLAAYLTRVIDATIAQSTCEVWLMRLGNLLPGVRRRPELNRVPSEVLNTGAKHPSVGGTIAGIVTTADASVAVQGQKVTAIETTTAFGVPLD
jgi:hypothetical protein